jgi:hypothetical protein
MHKDARKIKARIRSAFKKLYTQNILAFGNFTCCDTCGGAEIISLVKKDGFDGWAFYHMQDNDDINSIGKTYISFGDTKKIANKIVKALEDTNLKVQWDGSMKKRILVDGLKTT